MVIALVCAITAHAAVTIALRGASPKPDARVAIEPAALNAIDLEITVETRVVDAPKESAPSIAQHDAHAAIASAGARNAIASSVASSSASASPSIGGSIEAPSPPASGEADSTWSLRVTRVDIGVDPNGRASLVGRAATGASEPRGVVEGNARAPGSTTGGLTESLDENDVAMGLGRGGPIRSAVEEAVQAANVMGTAAFEVRVEASGGVTVGLREASADASSWSGLTETIRASVVAKRASVRIPPGARGLRVVVQADAKDLLPDGRSPSRLGTRVEGTVGSITETRQRIEIKLPSATLAHEGKVCAAGVHVGLDGIGILGGCSPENAGTTPVRMVAARILSEARL